MKTTQKQGSVNILEKENLKRNAEWKLKRRKPALVKYLLLLVQNGLCLLFNLMAVMICLILVDTGFIEWNINSSIISVNRHGTFCFLS